MQDHKTATTDPSEDAHGGAVRNPLAWSRQELLTLAIALGLLLFWIASFLLFGFAGLIITALLLVAGSFVALVLISIG